jgi:hypothetical protein
MFSLNCISQDKGDIRIGEYGQGMTMKNEIMPQFGLVGEIFLSHHLALNYKYGIGVNIDGGVSGHLNPAIFALGWFGEATSQAVFTLILLVPEGVSYHLYPNDYLEIAPFISPIGAEINIYPDPDQVLLSCAFGSNFYLTPFKKLRNLSFSVFGSATYVYKKKAILPSIGCSVNYTIFRNYNGSDDIN